LGWNHPAIRDNILSANSAPWGGGAFLTGSTPTFSGNTVTSNTADIGGGLVTESGRQIFINNVIAGNRASTAGSGLWSNGSSPQMFHNTIARNRGGDGSGVYVTQAEFGGLRSNVAFTNTVLVSHAVGIYVTGGNTVTADAILWHDTPITVSQSPTAVVKVQNEHTGDPAFASDGYHLTMVSAAIGRGVRAGITTDIDGDPRPAPGGTRPDLGADEISQYRVCLPLVIRSDRP
jgi:hypothetical protein